MHGVAGVATEDWLLCHGRAAETSSWDNLVISNLKHNTRLFVSYQTKIIHHGPVGSSFPLVRSCETR
jgi:hypothetical protein